MVAARTSSDVALALYGMMVVRVPAYSPRVADFESQPQDLSRLKPRKGNLALDGLLGFDWHGRTAGIVGTGKIGALVAGILGGFGCGLLSYDVASMWRLIRIVWRWGWNMCRYRTSKAASDIITLYCPKSPQLTISLMRCLWG